MKDVDRCLIVFKKEVECPERERNSLECIIISVKSSRVR